MTCGGRTIWFQKNHPSCLYIDNRVEHKGFIKERPNFEVKPDMFMDFTQLGFKDNTFKLVCWDPPHLIRIGKTSWMYKKYSKLEHGFEETIRKGFKEAFRVLEDYGVLIFKWNERDVPLSKILSLSEIKPLFGHTTGSKSLTHWITFMKIPSQSAILEGGS